MKNRKLIEFKCDYCDCVSEKPITEYNRNIKLGRHNFCSRSCACSYANKHRKGCSNAQKQHLLSICDNHKDCYSPFRYIYRNIKRRFKECNITLQNLKDLWEQQNGICPYTGIKLVLPTYSKNSIYFNLASLDRIDSNKGYIVGNIQFVSLPINLLKNTQSSIDVKRFLKQISFYTSHFCED